MANRVQVEFGASTGELKSAVDDVNSSLDSIKGHIEGLTEGFKSLGEIVGVALSFEGLKAGFESLAAFADQIQNAQAKMGGSLESMTDLSGIAAMTGISFQSLTQDVASASLQVQKSTSDAYGPATQGLKALGLSAKELSGLPTDQWFAKVSDAVSRFNPSMTLTSNVQQAFGHGFAQLMPLLIQGSEHFEELKEAVNKAQQGLASALPGISETEEKLTLLGLRSRAFAAQVFSTLKPAIDAAIDAFSNLTGSIKVDDIRDVANKIANSLIDIAANVASFLARTGVSIDQFKQKYAGIRLGFDVTIDGPAEKAIEWMARISGNYDRLKDRLSKPLTFTVGEADSGAGISNLEEQLKAIDEAAKRAHDAINGVVPVSGTWQALGQDMTRLNSEVLAAAEGFTKLNAAAANNSARNAVQALMARIDEEVSAEQAKFARVKQIFTDEANAYKITQQQKALYTETALEQMYRAEMLAESQKLDLWARGSKEYEAVLKQMAKLTQTYQKEMLQVVDASQKEQLQTITANLQMVTGAFNSQLRGLLAGTTSWASAMKNIAADMFMKMIELGEKWAVDHLAILIRDSLLQRTQAATDVVTHASAEAAKTEATVTGAAARASAETAGNAAGIATQIANAITSIGIDAGKVFAGVFGFLAPVMGPAAAGPAAASEAETFAAGMAPLAVGAWEIPGIMPALLHPGEMVMPATYAQGFRSAVSGGGNGQGGGSGASVSFNVSAFDTTGLQAMINRMMPQLARSLQSYQNLNPSTA